MPESGITITVLFVNGKRGRLGVEGPPTAVVHRAEVWQRIGGTIGSPPPQATGRPARHTRVAFHAR